MQQQREHQAQTGEVWQGWSDWTVYWKHIQAMGSVRQLVERPFMLTILVEVLPAMIKAREDSKSEGSLNNVTRLDLYEMFIQQWFKREKDKVSAHDMQEAKHHGQPAFRFQEGEDLTQDYGEFCENLAAYLFKAGQLTANYQPRWEVGERGSKRSPQVLDHFFKTSDPAVCLVLRGTPIIPQGKNRFGYLHKSVWEYFVACRIYHELSWGQLPWKELDKEQQPVSIQHAAKGALYALRHANKKAVALEAKGDKAQAEATQALAHSAERLFKGLMRLPVGAKRLGQRLAERRVAQQAVHALQERDPLKWLVSNRLLTTEPSIVRFLADFATREERFRRTLMYWVLASCTQPELAIASSNALTILNVARVPFSGMDLSGIRVPGADLSEGLFDHTNFTGADLRDVNFDNAFLCGAQLRSANTQGAFFEAISGQELETGELQYRGVIFTPDQNTVLFYPKSKDDKSIRVYDIKGRQWLPPIVAPYGEKIDTVTMSADSRTAFLYNDDSYHGGSREVTVYDVANQKLLAPIVAPAGESISKVSLSADGCTAFLHSGGVYGSQQVAVYDVVGQRPLAPIVAPDGERINEITLSADGRTAFLYRSGGVQQVAVYNLAGQKLLAPIVAAAGKIHKITLTPDGRTAFLYGDSPQVVVYDLVGQKLLAPIVAPDGGRINEITLSADGRTAFLYGWSNQVQMYDVAGQRPLAPIVGPAGIKINMVTLMADGRTAFCFYMKDAKEQVAVYDVAGRRLLASIGAPYGEKIGRVTLSADGRTAFLYGGSNQVQVYDMAGQKALSSIVAPKRETISEVTLSADGRTAFLYNNNKWDERNRQAAVYDVANQKSLAPIIAPEGEKINTVTLTADGRTAFFYHNHEEGGSRQVAVYNLAGQKLLAPIVAPGGIKINTVTLTADGRTAFFYSNEKEGRQQVAVYDVAGQRPLAPIVVPAGEKINTVILSADGRVALLYNRQYENQQVTVYDLAGQKLLAPIVMPAGEKINTVILSADGRVALLYNSQKGNRQIGVYDCQKKSLFLLRFDEAITGVRVFKEQVYCAFFSYYRCYVFNVITQEHFFLQQMKSRIKNVQLLQNGNLWIESEGSIYQSWNWQKVEQTRTAIREAKTGHSASVSCLLKLSPDSYVSSSEWESYFWQIQGARFFLVERQQIKIDKDTRCLTDGRTAFLCLRYAYGSQQVAVYNVAGQKLLAPIVAPNGKEIHQITLSTDGRIAFLYGYSPQVVVYDLVGQKQLAPIVALEDESLNEVTLSADGRTAFLYDKHGDGSQQVMVYNISNQQLLSPIVAPKGEKISDVTLSTDDRIAFLYGKRGRKQQVTVYDLASQKLLAPIEVPVGEEIRTVILSADGRFALLYNHRYKNQQVTVYDLVSQKLRAPIAAPAGETISGVTLSADGRIAFLYGYSSQVIVYDLVGQKQLALIVAPKGETIGRATLSADGRIAFLYNDFETGGSRQVIVYDLVGQKELAPIIAPDGEKINKVILAVDGRTAFLYMDNKYNRHFSRNSSHVVVYDVTGQKLLVPIKAEIDTVIFSADGRTAFLYSQRDQIQWVILYDLENQKQLAPIAASHGEKLRVDDHRVRVFLLSRGDNNEGDNLVSCWYYRRSGEQRIHLKGMNVQKSIDLPALSTATRHLQIPADEKASFSSALVETKAASPTQVALTKSEPPLRGMVFYGKGGCYVWSAQTNALITLFKGSEITAVELFGNGTQLVTAGQDATLRLWDISNLERPLLKDCTQGMTFYAQGAQFDERTQLSDENCRILQTRVAVKQGMPTAGLLPPTGSERPSEVKKTKKELKSAYELPADDSLRGNPKTPLSYATSSVVLFQEGRRANLDAKRNSEAKSQPVSSGSGPSVHTVASSQESSSQTTQTVDAMVNLKARHQTIR